jgi:glycosyltransferase involved in cell wall biosynthesis
MKKILVFIDWYWPGFKAGGPIRSMVNMTSHLKSDYSFWIVCRNTDYMSNEPYTQVQSNSWNELDPNVHVYYISNDRLSRSAIKSFFKEEDFDLVYINGIYSLFFSILPLRYSGLKTIVAPRGMLSGQTFSSKAALKKIFFIVMRIFGFYKKALFHATIEREADDIQKQLKTKRENIVVAPNLPRLLEDIPEHKLKQKEELRLISIARIAPEKNTLFAIQCLKKINSGEIKFDLFGELYNEEYWKQCKAEINSLPDNVKVNYKGSVNADDIPQTLTDYHMLLMPSKGENFGHSILESLMAGVPVIISENTPWRDLKEKNAGWDISLDRIDKFQEQIQVCLHMAQDEYNLISQSAFQLAKEFTSNENLLTNYKKMFE